MSAWAIFEDAGSRLDDTIKIDFGRCIVILTLTEVQFPDQSPLGPKWPYWERVKSNKWCLKPDLNRSREIKLPSVIDMVDLEITYCQPCGHQPRAVELVNQLLAEYGMPLNKKLTVALKPADSGIFDIVLDGQLIFSRKQEGRFPTVDEIKKQIEPKLSIPLEIPSK